MNEYLIKSFRGGCSDENDKGILGSCKFSYGLDIRGRADILTCGQALVKESVDVMTDKLNFIIPCTNGKAYGFGDAGCIYERSGTTWVKRYTDSNGAIVGAEEWNGYLYWATATKLSRIQISAIPSATWTTEVAHDWQTLTSASWHTMKIATGNLLICNDQYLALVDYATAAFNASALDLIPGNFAKCLEEDGDYVLIGSARKDNAEQGYLWNWYNTADSWIKKKKLSSKGVNGLITTELMLAQCGIDGEVYFSDMDQKFPIFRFPDGGFVLPGGVCDRKGLAMFGVSGNNSTKCGVYSYGRGKKNLPFALNLDYVPSPGLLTTIEIGAIQMVNGTLLVAWKNGSSYGVDALSASVKANAIYEGLEFSAGQPHKNKIFAHTKLTMNPLVSGCSIVLKYKVNGAANWTTAKTLAGGSSFSTALATKAVWKIDVEGEIFERRIELTPTGNSAPEIKSISSYFDFSNITDFD